MLLSIRDLRRLHLSASFDLDAGECVAMRGASGSGKTQLLRAIADLDPNEGTVLLDGTPREAVPAPAWRRLIAYIPAEPGWWADTVGGHFADWAAAAPLAERLGLPAAWGLGLSSACPPASASVSRSPARSRPRPVRACSCSTSRPPACTKPRRRPSRHWSRSAGPPPGLAWSG